LPHCERLLPLLLLTVTGALVAPVAAPPAMAESPARQAALPARLAELRSRSEPDSVELLVEAGLPAARADGDSALVRALLLERGLTRVAYGRAADGEPDLRTARARADAAGDTDASLRATRYLAEACQHLGRREESAALFGDLLTRARAAGDDFHAGKALYGLGRLRYRARALGAADSLYALALPLLAAGGDAADLAAVRNGLGMCRAGRGAHRAAAEQFALAADLARRGDSRSLEAMAMNNLAGIETVLGDPGAAADGYRRARDIQRELELWQQVGAPWRNLALSLKDLGRYDEAAAELDSALAFCRRRGFRDEEAFTLVRQAEVDLAAGRPAAAQERCLQVMALDPAPDLETSVTARVRLADALLALGRGDQALAPLAEAAGLLTGREDFSLGMMLAVARGRTLVAIGRHDEALSVLGPALARAGGPDTDRQRLPLLVGAAAAWAARVEPDSALACLDRAETLWERERSLPTDPQWRERRGAEAQHMFALRIDLEVAGGDVRRAFAAAQRYKARTLLERYLGPGEKLASAGDLPPPATVASLQGATLREGELLLDIVAGPDRGWLFAVTRDTCLVRSLPGGADLEDRLAPLIAQVSDPFRAFEPDLAAAAGDALLGAGDSPVLALTRRARAVFASPDGAWHRLPLAVLPQFADTDLRLAPSATLLARLRNAALRPAGSARLLAVAGQANADARRLDGARAEIADLRRRFRDVIVPTAAGHDTSAFGGLDPSGFAVLHLACHAETDPQRPWNSALVFGPHDRPVRVRAADIARLELDAQLAVLSSCASAGGTILAGEGVPGLAAAFLGAGVPGVVGTLWPVEDGTTRRFMDRFYAAVEQGAAPAGALVTARAALRAEPATAHPFYWAGFVLLGEGGEPVPLRPRGARAPVPWLAAAAIGLVAGAAAWRAVRRHRR
jgi:tetratricopeptide (TPR) repeat protein